MRTLLNFAVEAFHRGLNQMPLEPPAFKDAERVAKRLVLEPCPASERAVLARIRLCTQRALSLARRGQLDEATSALKSAQLLMLSLAHPSATSRAVARTTWLAAASYLSYRGGEYAQARMEMLEALRETDCVSKLTGDNAALSARRIHLLHNIMKVDFASGLTTEVPRIGFAVLRYLAEGRAQWPSDFGPGPQIRPDPLAAEYQSNKIVETIAEAFDALADRECKVYGRETNRLVDCPRPPSSRAWAWLSLTHLQFMGRTEEFLREAGLFLREGPGVTPKLWYAIALAVLVSYRKHEPVEAPGATEAMVKTLATRSTVPSFVRTRVSRGSAVSK